MSKGAEYNNYSVIVKNNEEVKFVKNFERVLNHENDLADYQADVYNRATAKAFDSAAVYALAICEAFATEAENAPRQTVEIKEHRLLAGDSMVIYALRKRRDGSIEALTPSGEPSSYLIEYYRNGKL